MSCNLGKATERVGGWGSAHSPTLPSLHLCKSSFPSFSNPFVGSPTSQFILQPFCRSHTLPGEPPMVFVCLYLFLSVLSVCLCLYLYICFCLCWCLYLYVYVFVSLYICLCVFICIWVLLCLSFFVCSFEKFIWKVQYNFYTSKKSLKCGRIPKKKILQVQNISDR